jgi:hypothetical protein
VIWLIANPQRVGLLRCSPNPKTASRLMLQYTPVFDPPPSSLSPRFQVMPVDRTAIKTSLRINPDLLKDPVTFIRDRELPVRAVKPSRGKRAHCPADTLTLDVLTYKGIKVKLSKTAGASLTSATIHFNPLVCLYGHNGRVLSLSEFLEALALLVTHLTPLLSNPDDWVDLIPGLRHEGRAYWSYLEVPFQCLDPDGTLLAAFRNARHRSLTTPTRHWPTSIQIGGTRSKLQFSIYQKAVEMVVHDKLLESDRSNYEDVLRLEVRMKEDKLLLYFGNERNVEVIDGTERLCRFYPQDLIEGHCKSFSEIEGVFASVAIATSEKQADKIKPLEARGRWLAMTALDPRTPQTFPELLAHIKFYLGESSDTIGKIRKAGLAELSRRSSLSLDDLFSDAAYRAQPEIYNEELEKKICRALEDLHAHPLVNDAYRPPDQQFQFQPITQGPGYARI